MLSDEARADPATVRRDVTSFVLELARVRGSSWRRRRNLRPVVSGWTPTEESRRAAARVWLDWVAAEACTTLRDHGVRAVLLKGPALARWLYADDPGRARTTTST